MGSDLKEETHSKTVYASVMVVSVLDLQTNLLC